MGARTGSVANYSLLFRAWAEEYPGDELVIFCNREVARYYESRLRFLDLPNVRVISWYAGFLKEPLRFWFHTFGLRRYIRRYSPDLIYSINIGPYFATKVPQVIQLNNSFQVCDWSLVRYHPKNRFYVAILRFFFRRSLAKCNAVVVQTELMRELLKSIPCSPERLAVMPKSVETERDLTPHPMPERIRQQLAGESSRKNFTYLYVATGSPHKNHIILIRAMEYARAQKSPLRLVLTLTKKELERMAGPEAKTALSLLESVHIILLGWITKDQLHGLYEACSGCVMPSMVESMSSSHLEAMRWNRPQISSDVPCHRDLCGDASLYVPAEDPRAWFEEMERLAGNPALQADLVKKGAKRILDFPQTWLAVARKYRTFFKEVISDSVSKGKNTRFVAHQTMNILQINSGCGIGSTGRIATDIHSILLSQGHSSTVAFGRYTAKNCIQHIRIGSSLDIYLHVARTRLFDSHGFGSAAATKALIAKIRELNPDLIHLHNLHGYYLHVGLLFEYLKQANKPVIWTLHDCWAFTGHCSHFDFIGCNRWKSECHDCPQKQEYPKSIFLDRSRRNYQQKKQLFTGVKELTIVTPSKWLENLVKESFLQAYPVAHIYNGIDLNVFKPTHSDFRSRYNLSGQFILLGVASIWSKRKGYQYFIDLAKQLRPDEKIVLVGVSEQQIKHLPTGIIGITQTNSAAELAEIYSAADLFINPSLEETFGLVNVEALACGTPVVTFNSGGCPECLADGCGLVVERGDLPGLVAAIAMMRKNVKEFYSDQCQKRAKDQFDKDARFAEYLEFYKSYLK